MSNQNDRRSESNSEVERLRLEAILKTEDARDVSAENLQFLRDALARAAREGVIS